MQQDNALLAEQLNSLANKVDTGFARLCIQHANMTEKVDKLSGQHEQLLHTLHGNGKEGLVTTVAKTVQRVKTIWIVLGAMGSSAATLGVFIVKDLMTV